MNNVYSQEDIRKLFISIPLSRVTLWTGLNQDLIDHVLRMRNYFTNKCNNYYIANKIIAYLHDDRKVYQ